MRAASSGDAGIICSDASSISIVKGNHSQVSASTMAHEREVGIGDERGHRQADEGHEAVERADVDGVHDPPQDADDDRRQHHGDEEARARQLAYARAAVEQQRHAEPDQQLQHTVATDSLTCTHTERVKRGSSNRSM